MSTTRRTDAAPDSPTRIAEAVESAEAAGLRYVSDRTPGIARKRTGAKAFRYADARGRAVRDAATLARIRALAIPPAWRDVWVSPHPNGHIQATGHDARGRKQYRYHARWREVRDEAKYTRLVDFARALPKIRRQVARDMRLPGLPRRKVIATVVSLLEKTMMRVGNEEYARENGSFGLTTLENRHAKVRGSTVRFRFRGKSGVQQEVEVSDPHVARIVARCQDLPGQRLLEYQDEDGEAREVDSDDVNAYLREISGQGFTAKDFRTWAGTLLAAHALAALEAFDSDARAKKNVVAAVERVAERLGNTRAVCRKCYIHPAIIEAYMDRSLVERLKGAVEGRLRGKLHSLSPEEAAVLALLHQRLAAGCMNAGGRTGRRAGRGRPSSTTMSGR
jgi:DNA topoisomerase-1